MLQPPLSLFFARPISDCNSLHFIHTGGRILFMGSLSSVGPGPTVAVYAATKAFLQSFAMVRTYSNRFSALHDALPCFTPQTYLAQ